MPPKPALTREDIESTVSALADLLAVMRDADAAGKAEICDTTHNPMRPGSRVCGRTPLLTALFGTIREDAPSYPAR